MRSWRDGTGLVNDAPATRRRESRYAREEIEAFAVTLRRVPFDDRRQRTVWWLAGSAGWRGRPGA